jgi:hypothetical protein
VKRTRSALARVSSAILFVGLLGQGCAPSRVPDSNAPLPQFLEPVAGASHVEKAVVPGYGAGVGYEVEVPYPAADFLADIQGRLARAGYVLEKEDLFNPGLKTGEGWGPYLDHSGAVHAAVHQWSAWWINKDGDHVTYMLEYRTSPFPGSPPPEVPANASLRVYAQFLTRDEAARMLESMPPRAKIE